VSSTSQVTDFSDLYTNLQLRVREETGVTASTNRAKQFINIALQDMHIGFREGMTWCERKATLITQPSYTTGTVTISQGSTTLTGASTAWTTTNAFGIANARANGKIVIAGAPEIYTVSSVGGPTTITLSSKFIPSDVSGETYVYFEDEYDLASDFLRPYDWQYFDQNRSIPLIGRREFRFRYPRNNVVGTPRVGTIFDYGPSGNTTPIRRLGLWQPPSDAQMITYNYITSNLATDSTGTAQLGLSADTDEPIVPIQYRHVIVYHALYHYYKDIRDDNRAVLAKRDYDELLGRIVGDTEIGRSRPQFRPKVASYVSSASRPYSRGRGRHYTTGNTFDEIRE
jgi:hypothetical protein